MPTLKKYIERLDIPLPKGARVKIDRVAAREHVTPTQWARITLLRALEKETRA